MIISLEALSEELERQIDLQEEQIRAEAQLALKNLANAVYSSIVEGIQNGGHDPKNRQTYLQGLKLEALNEDSYVIHLEGDFANALEDGYVGFDMKEKMLNSSSNVTAGPNAGQPWVKRNAKGKKYAHVPFGHKPFSKESKSGNMASAIKKLQAKNSQGEMQSLTARFNDAKGNPMKGKVATVKDTGIKNLDGITKYQHVHESGAVQSVYMTFRTISEDGEGWKHPGHKGYNLFKEARSYAIEEMTNILKYLGDK